MTLRELLYKSSYKQVFNEIYKKYYFGRATKKVTLGDIAFQRVWEELKGKSPHHDKGCDIFITEASVGKETHIDVSLRDREEGSLYGLDFYPWGELIDCPIDKGVKMNDSIVLAHILWEITFYGFSEKEISESRIEFNS